MEYVMVPVPEEFVDQVKSFMAWKLSAPKIAEQPDAVKAVFDDADEELRQLVRYVAQVTMTGGIPTLHEAADACGMNAREIVGALGELHTRLRPAGRKGLLIIPQVDARERPEDCTEWEHRVLHMSEADAEAILAF